MSLLNEHQLLLADLAGDIPKGRRSYLPAAQAFQWLVQLYQQNFGYDADAWARWLIANGHMRPEEYRFPEPDSSSGGH